MKDFPKRLFDIAFSGCVLLISLPLFLILYLLIRLSSPGPAFYKSIRVGRGGKQICCWKFRSMYMDADRRLECLLQQSPLALQEWMTYQKLKNDPRITPLGQFLRRSSLDEWPQFWNVFKGDLSIVGPRPPLLRVPPEKFQEEIERLYGSDTQTILSVRPGLTGVWQVSGRSLISFQDRVSIEREYVKTRTFKKDLILILKTIPAVLFSKGAY